MVWAPDKMAKVTATVIGLEVPPVNCVEKGQKRQCVDFKVIRSQVVAVHLYASLTDGVFC